MPKLKNPPSVQAKKPRGCPERLTRVCVRLVWAFDSYVRSSRMSVWLVCVCVVLVCVFGSCGRLLESFVCFDSYVCWTRMCVWLVCVFCLARVGVWLVWAFDSFVCLAHVGVSLLCVWLVGVSLVGRSLIWSVWFADVFYDSVLIMFGVCHAAFVTDVWEDMWSFWPTQGLRRCMTVVGGWLERVDDMFENLMLKYNS